MEPQDLIAYFTEFSEIIFKLWVKAKTSNEVIDFQQVEDLGNSPKIYTGDTKINRQPDKQALARSAMDIQRQNFRNIFINNFQIPVLISSDGYLVVKYQDDCDNQNNQNNHSTFFAFKVIDQNNSKKLEITGIDYKYSELLGRNEYRSGVKVEYLIKFLEEKGIKIPGKIREGNPDLMIGRKVDWFNRRVLGNEIIKNQQLLEREEAINSQNVYFKFYLTLRNELQNDHDIIANLEFYQQTINNYLSNQIQPEIIDNNQSEEFLELRKIFFNESLPPDSPYYIERKIDSDCKQEIINPRAYIRLKGPHKTGKTSLLYRLIDFGESQGYSIVFINFRQFKIGRTQVDISHLKLLCIWFCQQLSFQLGKEEKTNDYFNKTTEKYGPYILTKYLYEQFLQEASMSGFLLIMDNVDLVFDDRDMAESICNMLHSWHEEGGNPTDYGRNWSKLRIVLAHTTEIYLTIENINRSPCLNLGKIINYSDWNWGAIEVTNFSQIYDINLSEGDINRLLDLTGGHPHLIRLAIQYLFEQQTDFENLSSVASQPQGPFANYLNDEILLYLKQKKYEKYESAFYKVIKNQPFNINFLEEKEITFKLQAMGLIKPKVSNFNPDSESKFEVKCELYVDYFTGRLNEYE